MPNIPATSHLTGVTRPCLPTDEQVFREISWLRELFEARMNAMDVAVLLLQSSANKAPTIAEIAASHGEKFASVAAQFVAKDNAINIAITAAEKAVDKQNNSITQAIERIDASVTKQTDQIKNMATLTDTAVNGKIGDLKERLTIIESREVGARRVESRHGEIWGYVVGGIGLMVAVAMALGTLMAWIMRVTPH